MNINTEVNRITLRLIPEASKVKNGPEMATIKANILTSKPACEVVILNFWSDLG